MLFHGGRVAGASALARGARVRVGEPALAGGRFANRPYDRGGAESGECAGAPFVCPQDRPFDRLRANGFGKSRVRWGVGDAMGDGDAPRCAPALGSRIHGNDDGVVGVGEGWWWGPFDRLRANGFGKCACGREWGMRWRTETPRAAPLWIPAFAGMTRVGECGKDDGGSAGREGCWWLRAHLRARPRQALREGLRANGFGKARVRWGVGDAMGDGGAPRRAPLDSCLRRNDARGGVRVVMRGPLVAEGPPLRMPSGQLRQAQGERIWEAHFVLRGEWGMRWGRETPRGAPALGPFTGTRWGCGGDAGSAGGGGSRSRGTGGSRTAPTDSGGVRGSTTVAFAGRNLVWLSGLALV